jgi:uncharacterized protein (DUF934 family)
MIMTNTLNLIAFHVNNTPANSVDDAKKAIKIANDSDVAAHCIELSDAQVVELDFPAFSDGRAFSQAVQLRKRLGFKGDIRATGDVLVDQLVQMQRSGFTSAVLREDQSVEHGQKLLSHYSNFYQGDVANRAAFSKGLLA